MLTESLHFVVCTFAQLVDKLVLQNDSMALSAPTGKLKGKSNIRVVVIQERANDGGGDVSMMMVF
jgi:hypothetical protein